MRLINILEQGHWEVAKIDYPNSLAPSKEKERISFLVNPKDRDRFFKRKPDKLPKAKKR